MFVLVYLVVLRSLEIKWIFMNRGMVKYIEVYLIEKYYVVIKKLVRVILVDLEEFFEI